MIGPSVCDQRQTDKEREEPRYVECRRSSASRSSHVFSPSHTTSPRSLVRPRSLPPRGRRQSIYLLPPAPRPYVLVQQEGRQLSLFSCLRSLLSSLSCQALLSPPPRPPPRSVHAAAARRSHGRCEDGATPAPRPPRPPCPPRPPHARSACKPSATDLCLVARCSRAEVRRESDRLLIY